VASDADKKISKAYDATIFFTSYTNRTSYVIAPDGTIIYEYTALSPDKHVETHGAPHLARLAGLGQLSPGNGLQCGAVLDMLSGLKAVYS